MEMKANSVEILLVEDRPEDAELAMMALKQNNLANSLVWVKDGQEALDFVFARGQYEARSISNQPKLILLDLKLPKVDGIEVLRKIRADPKLKSLLVVVLTTSREEKDIMDAYGLGVNSYIVKPVDFEKFTATVKNLGYYWLLINEPPKLDI